MILEFLIVFLIIFIINYLLNYLFMKKNDNLIANKAFNYIVLKYKLKLDNKKINILSKVIIIINTIIISIPIEIILRWNFNYYLVISVSFILFIVLILISYNLLGYILKKKGW